MCADKDTDYIEIQGDCDNQIGEANKQNIWLLWDTNMLDFDFKVVYINMPEDT